MEKDLKVLFTFDEEEEDEIITAPYYIVIYVDDCLHTHIATVKEDWYLRFLKDRYYIKECKYVGFETFDKKEK